MQEPTAGYSSDGPYRAEAEKGNGEGGGGKEEFILRHGLGKSIWFIWFPHQGRSLGDSENNRMGLGRDNLK